MFSNKNRPCQLLVQSLPQSAFWSLEWSLVCLLSRSLLLSYVCLSGRPLGRLNGRSRPAVLCLSGHFCRPCSVYLAVLVGHTLSIWPFLSAILCLSGCPGRLLGPPAWAACLGRLLGLAVWAGAAAWADAAAWAGRRGQPAWPSWIQWFTRGPSGLPVVFQWFSPVVYSSCYGVLQAVA